VSIPRYELTASIAAMAVYTQVVTVLPVRIPAHRDDGTMRREDNDEMRNARRARRQDETPTTMRALESVARIGGTDKSNNQLDDDSERGRGSSQKQPRQQQSWWGCLCPCV